MKRFAAPVALSAVVLGTSCGLVETGDDSGDDGFPGYPRPDSVSEVTWEWSAPEGLSVAEVLPVPSGAALAVTDGVIVLDGREGRELWSHRESDTSTPEVDVTPDGGTVVLDHPSSQAGAATLDLRTVVLDARTGRVRGEYERAGFEDPDQDPVQGYEHAGVLSREHRIRWDEAEGALVAHHLVSGDRVWALEDPARGDDRAYTSVIDVRASSETVFLLGVGYDDPDPEDGENEVEVSVTALDASDGELLWRESSEVEVSDFGFRMEVDEEDGSLSFLAPGLGWTVLDLGSGEPISTDEDEGEWDPILETGSRGVLRSDISTDEESVSYHWTDLSGEVERRVDVTGRPAERDVVAPVDLGDQIIRLDYLVEDSLERGPVTLEAISWDDGTLESIPLGFDLRGGSSDGEGSPYRLGAPPGLTVVPGAVVVGERASVTQHLIGIG
ncbi:hypothetical protein VSQ78_11015 [Nocardiopsis alba]|uniref:PQQ enzyme repeat family protein n=1 Tax=Nocardiopsis alba TaxID=53437 RepID=A0ABV5DUI1_9ACTN